MGEKKQRKDEPKKSKVKGQKINNCIDKENDNFFFGSDMQNPNELANIPKHPTTQGMRHDIILKMQQQFGNASVQRYLEQISQADGFAHTKIQSDRSQSALEEQDKEINFKAVDIDVPSIQRRPTKPQQNRVRRASFTVMWKNVEADMYWPLLKKMSRTTKIPASALHQQLGDALHKFHLRHRNIKGLVDGEQITIHVLAVYDPQGGSTIAWIHSIRSEREQFIRRHRHQRTERDRALLDLQDLKKILGWKFIDKDDASWAKQLPPKYEEIISLFWTRLPKSIRRDRFIKKSFNDIFYKTDRYYYRHVKRYLPLQSLPVFSVRAEREGQKEVRKAIKGIRLVFEYLRKLYSGTRSSRLRFKYFQQYRNAKVIYNKYLPRYPVDCYNALINRLRPGFKLIRPTRYVGSYKRQFGRPDNWWKQDEDRFKALYEQVNSYGYHPQIIFGQYRGQKIPRKLFVTYPRVGRRRKVYGPIYWPQMTSVLEALVRRYSRVRHFATPHEYVRYGLRTWATNRDDPLIKALRLWSQDKMIDDRYTTDMKIKSALAKAEDNPSKVIRVEYLHFGVDIKIAWQNASSKSYRRTGPSWSEFMKSLESAQENAKSALSIMNTLKTNYPIGLTRSKASVYDQVINEIRPIYLERNTAAYYLGKT